MDVLYVILIVVVIIVLITNQNSLNKKIGDLELLVINLQSLIKKLSEVKPLIEPPKPASLTVSEEKKPVVMPDISQVQVPGKPLPPEPYKPEIVERHNEVITDPVAELRKSRIKTALTWKSLSAKTW
jgi:hypothetical protein